MQRLVSTIVSAAISHGVVQEKDRELYEYSFQIMLEQASIGVSILISSLLLGVFFETVLYMVLFIPLRIYAGGYHARTFGGCYVVSLGVYLTYVVLLRYVVIPRIVILVVVFISTIAIFLLAPMEDPNKAMEMDEKKKFKKIVRTLLLVEVSIFAIIMWTNYDSILFFVSFVFLHLALLLVTGFYTFKRYK